MKIFINTCKAFIKQLYISFYYLFRNVIRWKKVNSVYLCITDKMISKNLFGNIVFGDYEIHENEILNKTLSCSDVVLELGTGLGYNSISAAKINNNKVTTFEANPHLHALIRQNIKKNNVDFVLKNEIVLSKNFNKEKLEFTVVEDFWSSSLKSNINGRVIDKVNVPVCDVSEILKELNPTYLIVDIEGGEEDFFEDCTFLTTSSISKILLELHSDIIGEEKCSMVIRNIINSGFKICLDSYPKNVIYFYR